jgi:hypothetical protein
VPDDVLGRIDAALEDWERGPDAARWHADGGPDELGEWVAYCAPGRRVSASVAVGMSAYASAVTSVRESPFLEGPGVVLVRTEALELPPMPPVTFTRAAAPDWVLGHLIAASVNRPMSLLPGVV